MFEIKGTYNFLDLRIAGMFFEEGFELLEDKRKKDFIDERDGRRGPFNIEQNSANAGGRKVEAHGSSLKQTG